MLGYFILGVSLLTALLLASQWIVNVDPKLLARLLRYTVVAILGGLAAFFLLSGRFGLGLMLAVFAVGFLRRLRLPNFKSFLGGLGRPSPGQTSDVETGYLRMTLEHDSGVMRGEVLKGAYAGKSLSELNVQQLIAVLEECHREDPEAAQLLETYLDRTEGADWRDAAQAESTGGRSRWGRGSAAAGRMTREEALEVLGVDANAGADEIRDAHRQLMLKLHPDKGGSSYLAAKINQAKDVLLDA